MHIAICDDNVVLLTQLKQLIYSTFMKYTDDIQVDTYSSGALLLNTVTMNKYQVIFLDIDMPEVSGFDIARSIRKDLVNSFIIFITSHSELVYKSFDFQPFHFIQKKCELSLEESISRIVKKLMKHMKQYERVELIDRDSKRHFCNIHDIVYIESEKHYLNYYTVKDQTPINVRGSIKECEEKYSEYDFVKIHKRYLINLKYLAYIDNTRNEVVLNINNIRLVMSKNYKKDVDEKYTLYLRSLV